MFEASSRKLAFLFLLIVTACAGQPQLSIQHVDYAALQGWQDEQYDMALQAFRSSCEKEKPLAWPKGWPQHSTTNQTSIVDLCAEAQQVPLRERGLARQFFEAYFTPYRLLGDGDEQGLFTGYYVPLLKGSLTKTARYRYPAYAVPKDLVKGKAYHDRAAIEAGALRGKGLELVWVDDPVMLFFLHIQGSGFVELPNGARVQLRYAGKNGHAYTAIGKPLIEMGAIPREKMSMQAIRDWLHQHPERADEVMNLNASYVFFTLEREGAVRGAHGTPLTPERSLAVDDDYLPYGLPLFLETTLPDGSTWRRLVMAQDTGGAIKGPVRGDVFFGYGDAAGELAGRMQGRGRYTALIPKDAR